MHHIRGVLSSDKIGPLPPLDINLYQIDKDRFDNEPNIECYFLLGDYRLRHIAVCCRGLIASSRDPNPPGSSGFENARYGEITGSFDVECATEAGVTRARANDL